LAVTRGTRRRLPAGERRTAILDAAMQEFAARGFHGASIDEIARAAGISKALIYEHFPSKEELHVELIERHAGELFRRLAASAGREPGPARLEAGVDAYFRFVEEESEAWRMLFREPLEPQMAGVREQVVEQVTGVVAALIAADPAVSSHREQVSEMLAQMLVGAAQSLSGWWVAHPQVPRRHVVEMVMDFAWLGLDRLRAGERWSAGGA
jgi:AcrR family transcriptional regulator